MPYSVLTYLILISILTVSGFINILHLLLGIKFYKLHKFSTKLVMYCYEAKVLKICPFLKMSKLKDSKAMTTNYKNSLLSIWEQRSRGKVIYSYIEWLCFLFWPSHFSTYISTRLPICFTLRLQKINSTLVFLVSIQLICQYHFLLLLLILLSAFYS